jgi:transposase
MWVASQDLPRSAAHPFYARLNQILDKHDFERFVAGLCRRFYAKDIGPGLPPGRYFRLLLIGYFVEGSDAKRAIAWLAADSLSCANFSDCAPVCPAWHRPRRIEPSTSAPPHWKGEPPTLTLRRRPRTG